MSPAESEGAEAWILTVLCAMLQKSELQRLFHAHKGKRDCVATIVAEFPGRLSKAQIRSQLRRLGLQLKQPALSQQVRYVSQMLP